MTAEQLQDQTEAAGGASAVDRRVMRCRWDYDEDMDAHETECGHAFTLIEGTPSENDMRFCPYCGGELWESCGKRNNGVRCRMRNGSKCPDCGHGLHDFGGQD